MADTPNEAPSIDGLEDFDWADFDMECHTACNVIDAAPERGWAIPESTMIDKGETIPEAVAEVSCHSQGFAEAIAGCKEQTEKQPWDDLAPVSGGSQLIDCKTANQGIRVHRYEAPRNWRLFRKASWCTV